jgi:hypothetical protein
MRLELDLLKESSEKFFSNDFIEIRRELAKKSTDFELLDILAKDVNPSIRRHVMYNEYINMDTLYHLINEFKNDTFEFEKLLKNKNLPEKVLRLFLEIWKDNGNPTYPSSQYSILPIIFHPNFTKEFYNEFFVSVEELPDYNIMKHFLYLSKHCEIENRIELIVNNIRQNYNLLSRFDIDCTEYAKEYIDEIIRQTFPLLREIKNDTLLDEIKKRFDNLNITNWLNSYKDFIFNTGFLNRLNEDELNLILQNLNLTEIIKLSKFLEKPSAIFELYITNSDFDEITSNSVYDSVLSTYRFWSSSFIINMMSENRIKLIHLIENNQLPEEYYREIITQKLSVSEINNLIVNRSNIPSDVIRKMSELKDNKNVFYKCLKILEERGETL